MAKNVAVGILRPHHIFFYEVDCGKDLYFRVFQKLLKSVRRWFKKFSISKTKNGYHLIGKPYSRKVWNWFKMNYPSDFTKKLRSRWGRKNPQVLRISEKWDLKTGKVVSPKPKFICGNLFLQGIMDYKVLYYAK